MTEIRALIAAAGAGTRAGLPYPKTLHPVLGRPILLRQFDLLSRIDDRPTVIVSPSGKEPIGQCLEDAGFDADLIVQREPRGMGDAVIQFERAPARAHAEHVVLTWGDIPLLEADTLAAMVNTHLTNANDFTFVTANVDKAYTVVRRNESGAVLSVSETRELAIAPEPGEREIGLFMFRPDPILAMLAELSPGAIGGTTNEHGFLYIIEQAQRRGLKIEALPIATENDVISMNSLSDLDPITGGGTA